MSYSVELEEYNAIKNLGLLDEEKYSNMHSCINPVLHFVETGSKTDSIDEKIKYINGIKQNNFKYFHN